MLCFFNKFNFVLNNSIMVCLKLSIATRWQISGRNSAELSCQEIGHQLGWNHTVISRLVQKCQQTNHVKDRDHPGQHRKTSPQQDGILRLFRRYPFSSSTNLRDNWISNRAISMRTVRNRLKTAGYASDTSTQSRTFGMVSGTPQMES